ncbi:MAG: hypothetical protein K6T51_12215 [Rubrobacteraceae bacterium]|uniref:hypothetical protein n=1 Tax=Rubrobacter naiadicus TaxID=1392641 RepID=UPI0023605E75|nr:hypothetical protein [Rubrobacter naiadicus]MBX6762714.1 hypothetical protein [Rubrobacteraceae bacterium]MCL6439366.1 hypothetical protein [Rubrobacteraceae bacterium]
MVETAGKTEQVAWQMMHLEDYEQRLERAARRLEELFRDRDLAALVIYEAVLARSGRPGEEIRDLVRRFRRTFEEEDEPLSIPKVSSILNSEGDEWFFGSGELRRMAGRLLGQFQHRVAQYNYLDEREVLRRWADSADTKLFVRRRIPETEPVAGVVPGVDLNTLQYLRVAAGGNTVLPTSRLASALGSLGVGSPHDDYEVIGLAEELAFGMELPAPLVAQILEEIAEEGAPELPEYPAGQEEGVSEEE